VYINVIHWSADRYTVLLFYWSFNTTRYWVNSSKFWKPIHCRFLWWGLVLFQQLSCCSIGYYICFGGTDYPALIKIVVVWWDKIVVVSDCCGWSPRSPLLFIYLHSSHHASPRVPILFLQLSSSPSIIPTTSGFLTLLCSFLHHCSYFPFGRWFFLRVGNDCR